MNWKNFRNRMTAMCIAVGMTVTSIPTWQIPMSVQAAQETVESLTLEGVKEEASQRYTTTKTGFHLNLLTENFDGTQGLDYSTDTDNRKYMEVFNTLKNTSNDQTVILRFKTSQPDGLIFGAGANPTTEDGSNMSVGLQGGKLRLVLRNSKQGGLRGNFSGNLADGKWHTVAISFLPSKGNTENNVRLVIDGGDELYGASAWYQTWIAGFNQKPEISYTDFQIGNGSYVGTQSATRAFSGSIDFITVLDKGYETSELQLLTSQDKNMTNIASNMFVDGTCKTWLFTGGTETVADFNSNGTVRNYVGLFEDNLRAAGSYVERSRFVFNTAKRDSDVQKILEEYDTRIAAYGTSVVAVMIGKADYTKGDEGLVAFKSSLKSLTDRIIRDGKYPLLITPYPSEDTEKQDQIVKYKNAVIEVADGNVKVIDLSTIALDQIHVDGTLTLVGHQTVANTIKNELGITGKNTNFNFALQDGAYSIAKKNTDGQEATVQEVTSTANSITVNVGNRNDFNQTARLGYELTNKKGQKISALVTEGEENFTISGLQPSTAYELQVYDLSRKADKSIKETFKPVEITTIAGNRGTNKEYTTTNGQGNGKIKELLTSENPATYLFMGDSITHGIVTQGYDNVPQLFAKYLDELGRKDDVVLNTGVSNATLSTTLDQLDHRLRKYQPDVVMIMLGTNDSSTNGQVVNGDVNGVAQFKERYKTLVRKIYEHKEDASIVLRVPCEMLVDAAHRKYKEFFATIHDVASEMRTELPGINIVVVDHMKEWNTYKETVRNDNIEKTGAYGWLVDNVHPNGRGNISMFQQIIRELGIYKSTSQLANYQYKLDDWTGTSSITALVSQNNTEASFVMNTLSSYGNSLSSVTVTLTDRDGRSISKTENYDVSKTITLEALEPYKTYTAKVTGKDAVTNKEITFATSLSIGEATDVDKEKHKLNLQIQKAEALKGEKYSIETWQKYQEAITTAKAQVENKSVTVAQLVDAGYAIRMTAGRLELRTQKVGDKLAFDEEKSYIIYNTYDESQSAISGRTRALYDDGGSSVGWLKYDGNFETGHAAKYRWRVKGVVGQEGQYYLRNGGTKFAVKNTPQTISNSSNKYVISDKTAGAMGEPFTFEIKEIKDGKYYVAIKAVATNQYIAPQNGSTSQTQYAVFQDAGDNKNNWWCMEEAPAMSGLDDVKLLWTTPTDNVFYRIPAIATANDGTLIAVTDARYDSSYDLGDNWPGHPRGHQIDLLYKTSMDNGKSWSSSVNLTEGYSVADDGVNLAKGFGDAAIVADRESGKVLILCASGSYGFVSSDQKIRASKLVSEDNGKTFSAPEEVADEIYSLNSNFKAFFFASGRIMQSRYVKVGEYYRIYSAILAHTGNFSNKANWIVYSDDFGKTWKLLGDKDTSPVPAGDEAKMEELPNGSVVISSRKGSGRYFNVFDYDKTDNTYGSGSWEGVKSVTLGNGQATNGETMIVYAKNKETNEYGYLALQSLPAGNGRTHVAIYYKELENNDTTAANLVTGWSEENRFMVQEGGSAYSTMNVQIDGTLGFFWEEADSWYDMAYKSLSISEITGGKYEAAFTGIGSKENPYKVETIEQRKAVTEVYSQESVNWEIIEETIQPVTSVTLSQNTLGMEIGEAITLTATVAPENATNKIVTWTSSNSEVVTIDEVGKVNAIKAGTAEITATAGEKTAKCVVTVTEKPPVIDEKADLKKVIAQAEALQEDQYTKETYGKVKEALKTAKLVLEKEDATKKEIEDATRGLIESIEQLEEQKLNGWVKDSTGWIFYINNVAIKSRWHKVNNKWYYFEKSGYMKTGWLKDSGKWYFLDKNNGHMKTGWLKEGGKWYFLDKNNGSMKTSWLKEGGKWYFLHKTSGAMQVGWFKEGGNWYYLDKSSGAMRTGWLKDESRWYYLNNNGKMVVGWVKLKGTWYYTNTSGVMQTGWVKIKGTWYYLKNNGAMATGWVKVKGISYYLSETTGAWNGATRK